MQIQRTAQFATFMISQDAIYILLSQVYPGEKTGEDVVVETDAVWASSTTVSLRVRTSLTQQFTLCAFL